MQSVQENIAISESGSEYGFRCTTDGNGEIFNHTGQVRWRFRTKRRNGILGYMFLDFSEFLFSIEPENWSICIISSQTLLKKTFFMSDHGASVCEIRRLGLLAKTYEIKFNSGAIWHIHIPLFSRFYEGVSNSGARINIQLLRHDTWHVRIFSDCEDIRLLAALAFIHRDRQRA